MDRLHTVLPIGVIALLVFLWTLGGWRTLIPGVVFTIVLYVMCFWPDLVAFNLRRADRQKADAEARKIERQGP